MKFYKLECLNADGEIEINGYYIKKDNAAMDKTELDTFPENKRFGIVQNIVEIETED